MYEVKLGSVTTPIEELKKQCIKLRIILRQLILKLNPKAVLTAVSTHQLDHTYAIFNTFSLNMSRIYSSLSLLNSSVKAKGLVNNLLSNKVTAEEIYQLMMLMGFKL